MKKLAVFLVSMLFAVMLTAQPLTHRGGNPLPAQLVLVEFADFQPGDVIYSAYTWNGEYYASWSDQAKPGKFFIRCMGNDSDNSIKTGVDADELPVYMVYRNEQFSLINLTITRHSGYYSEGTITDTRQPVALNHNLYHYLCPVWPKSSEVIPYKPPRLLAEYFRDFLPFNDFMPKYTLAVDFEIVTGDGRLTKPPRATNMPNSFRYRFMQSDFDRGYIILLVKVTPFVNCTDSEPQLEKEISILLSR